MDVEVERLPHVDEHSAELAAGLDASWEAVVAVAEQLPTRGFRVARSVPGKELGLVGHHPFSVYALIFRLDRLGRGRTRVRAETRAAFPHLRGRVYRTLVIGTRIHVLATRRILAAMRRRAERP